MRTGLLLALWIWVVGEAQAQILLPPAWTPDQYATARHPDHNFAMVVWSCFNPLDTSEHCASVRAHPPNVDLIARVLRWDCLDRYRFKACSIWSPLVGVGWHAAQVRDLAPSFVAQINARIGAACAETPQPIGCAVMLGFDRPGRANAR